MPSLRRRCRGDCTYTPPTTPSPRSAAATVPAPFYAALDHAGEACGHALLSGHVHSGIMRASGGGGAPKTGLRRGGVSCARRHPSVLPGTLVSALSEPSPKPHCPERNIPGSESWALLRLGRNRMPLATSLCAEWSHRLRRSAQSLSPPSPPSASPSARHTSPLGASSPETMSQIWVDREGEGGGRGADAMYLSDHGTQAQPTLVAGIMEEDLSATCSTQYLHAMRFPPVGMKRQGKAG